MSVWEALGDLDRGQPRMGEQLICALREAIEQGRLAAGTRLPSTRDLATDLGVSRGLVVGVYERLIAEGRLDARRGSGTVVTGQVDPAGTDTDTGAVEPEPARPERVGHDTPGLMPVGWSPVASPPAVALLRPGVPDLGLFPRTAWRRAYERALAQAADADFDYGDPAGAFRLRAELAAYLSRTRVARVDVDRLVVTSGATQAFGLVARVLRAAGATRIGVEDPGSRRLAGCLQANGLTPVAVPVDAAGIEVAALERADVSAVLVTPAHQYPTGVVLAPQRRAALLDWARHTNAVVVEDDYDAEFRFDREPVGCLQGLAPEHVVLVGSASRTIAPALRIGWLVSPRRLRSQLCEAKRDADAGGSALEQLAFAELLAGAAYDRHLRRVKRTLRERRDAIVTAIRRNLPTGRILGVAAGLHLAVELPADVDDAALAERARAAGLAPLPLSSLRARLAGPPGLVLGYAAHPPHALTRAVRTLVQIVHVASATSGRFTQPSGPF